MFSKSVVELSKSFPCHRAGCLNYVHVVFSSTASEKLSPVQVAASTAAVPQTSPLCPGEDSE